ncbi:MAG: 2-oxo-4-hydroxy-4-carboxy-5-ureidoimidazoline decarboxylase [Myxococcota bacterium]
MSAAAILDAASPERARELLSECCGATRFVDHMLAARPFASDRVLHEAAERIWAACDRDDILEAFSHHPRIGADLGKLRERFGGARAALSTAEQAGAVGASEEVLLALQEANARYEARFGYIFIVCASGKTAEEMLGFLEARLSNAPANELVVAAAEQAKITRLRLERLADRA